MMIPRHVGMHSVHMGGGRLPGPWKGRAGDFWGFSKGFGSAAQSAGLG